MFKTNNTLVFTIIHIYVTLYKIIPFIVLQSFSNTNSMSKLELPYSTKRFDNILALTKKDTAQPQYLLLYFFKMTVSTNRFDAKPSVSSKNLCSNALIRPLSYSSFCNTCTNSSVVDTIGPGTSSSYL